MIDKYQEALNRLFQYYVLKDNSDFCENYHNQEKDIETLQELIDKYKKIKYPRFVPCKCGKNRRHGTYNWENGWKNKTITFECMGCGTKVTTKGSEVAAIKHWNEVMNDK